MTNVKLMLGHRIWRWANIKPTLCQTITLVLQGVICHFVKDAILSIRVQRLLLLAYWQIIIPNDLQAMKVVMNYIMDNQLLEEKTLTIKWLKAKIALLLSAIECQLLLETRKPLFIEWNARTWWHQVPQKHEGETHNFLQ